VLRGCSAGAPRVLAGAAAGALQMDHQWDAGAGGRGGGVTSSNGVVDNRRPLGIIGGTGMVGRALAAHLQTHPMFKLGPVVGSSSTTGKLFKDVWLQKEQDLVDHYGADFWKPIPFPDELEHVRVASLADLLASDCREVVSCIAARYGEIEDELLREGVRVYSISPHARFDASNPLCIPEVNGEVLERFDGNGLIKSPNCCSCGAVIALKALHDKYEVVDVSMTTSQSLSGRGDAKYPKELVVGNVLPLRNSEERTDEYQYKELKRILPDVKSVSVSAYRVPVQLGHLVDVRVRVRRKPKSFEEVVETFRNFKPLKGINLPSVPKNPITYVEGVSRPLPAFDCHNEGGMSIAVGNLMVSSELFDITFSYVVNNIVRGAFGAALINAEYYDYCLRKRAALKGSVPRPIAARPTYASPKRAEPPAAPPAANGGGPQRFGPPWLKKGVAVAGMGALCLVQVARAQGGR